MRGIVTTLSTFCLLGLLGPGAATTWNDTGHQVVALIAWDNPPEPTRRKVMTLLAQSANPQLRGQLKASG
jgi:hypothetical protein